MDYQLIRSKRRSIAIEITPQNALLVRAPMRASIKDIEAFIKKQEAWIEKHRKNTAPLPPPLSREEMKDLLEKAKADLPPRVAHFANILHVDYGRITIRFQKTRWGSCSSKGNLNFNALLMLAPERVRDYVVAHELCHLYEMNHGPAFWQLVEKIWPSYKSERQWLKDHGSALMAKRISVHKKNTVN